MKIIMWMLGVILTPILLFGVAQYFASERVEVVELETVAESGEAVVTRLWVVDQDDRQYLRVGSGGSGWYTRLQANPEIKVTRGGETEVYTTVSHRDMSDDINRLMQEKYTWGDTFIGAVFGRDNAIAIELIPKNRTGA